jgi:hypothetical protein
MLAERRLGTVVGKWNSNCTLTSQLPSGQPKAEPEASSPMESTVLPAEVKSGPIAALPLRGGLAAEVFLRAEDCI